MLGFKLKTLQSVAQCLNQHPTGRLTASNRRITATPINRIQTTELSKVVTRQQPTASVKPTSWQRQTGKQVSLCFTEPPALRPHELVLSIYLHHS